MMVYRHRIIGTTACLRRLIYGMTRKLAFCKLPKFATRSQVKVCDLLPEGR